MRSPETATLPQPAESIEAPSVIPTFWESQIITDAALNIESPRKFTSWQSGLYLNELRQVPKHKIHGFLPELKQRVRQDAFSFLKEFGAYQRDISYDDYSEFGIEGGYSSSDTVERCKRFVHYQQVLGRPVERALIDVDVQTGVRSWIKDTTIMPGSLCIVTSPRGTEDDGYPGLKPDFYNCIYIFYKKENGSTVFRQVHNWDNNEQLLALQETLAKKGTLQQVSTRKKNPPKEYILLSRYITLPPEAISAKELESLLYQNKSTWTIDADALTPKIESTLLNLTLSKLADTIADEFINKIVAAQALTNKLPESLNQEMDDLIEIFRDAVNRWSHDNAENINEKQKQLTDLTSPEKINNLIQAWRAKTNIKKGIATQEDKHVFDNFQSLVNLPVASPLHQAASMAHCIAGTPLSLTNQLSMLQAPELFSAIQTGNVTRSQLEQLIGKDRAALWHHGTCANPDCKFEGLVGECNLCIKCEMNPAGLESAFNSLQSKKANFLDSLSDEDKNEAKELLDQLYDRFFKKTISFEELINNDFVNPTATVNDELEPYMDRILFAPNGLEELRKITIDLSINKSKKEHNNYGGVFALPNDPKDQTKVAA